VSGYPLLDVFLSMMWFFIFILWIMLLFRVISDLFRSDDLGGWGKAAWLIFVLIVPFLGVFVYLIVRGNKMAAHAAKYAAAQQDAFNQYVQQATNSSTSSAEELSKLADLHQRGVLTDAEFAAQKAKLLS
jgi:Short C-terminal domain/Phospholipase_D-nuclease N-terminal